MRRDVEGEATRSILERVEAELRKRIGPGIYGVDGETFPSAVAKSLRAQEATLAIAEVVHGWPRGRAGDVGVGRPACSSGGSVVAYQDEVKTGVLGVKPETIADFGAVSEPTAREMAEGAKRVCGSSVAVAITGIAGPRGARTDKPVGHGLLRGVRAGHDARLDEAVRGRSRARAPRRGLLRAGSARRYFDTRKR